MVLHVAAPAVTSAGVSPRPTVLQMEQHGDKPPRSRQSHRGGVDPLDLCKSRSCCREDRKKLAKPSSTAENPSRAGLPVPNSHQGVLMEIGCSFLGLSGHCGFRHAKRLHAVRASMVSDVVVKLMSCYHSRGDGEAP